MKKIAILSHVVIDEIHRPGETESVEQIGGAGAYAAVGASLVSEPGRALIVSGVGRADRPAITEWATSRGIDPSGLFDVGEHSPRTHIEYFDDGDRVETPVYGLEHFEAHTPLPRHLPQSELAGVYLFHAHEASYWDQVGQLPHPILWEISRDSCHPSHLARVRELAATIDVLSINVAEAEALLGDSRLADLAPIVVLRAGERGSLVIKGSERIEVPAIPVIPKDPTGGGNSYSGAFIAIYAATGDPAAAGRAAAEAAGVVVSSAGTPAVIRKASS
ncbi:sugar/nucleoside kinase (ribokinase family) [Kribbella antiqua]|uniref:Sugar/nucleoside kinase (Ribokinase family) n=1 Tax=Kribbella antiqua TaxID=2512217 RepID=A0A4V6NNH5_9ACTN|nr:PfkB family carbohydrate kinase [Kribbella antiqua]TCO44020.1 sugar/nucleoside kinase (ribokinase family) [Kribbella antiqua]